MWDGAGILLQGPGALWYHTHVKTLIETNRYLHDRQTRERWLRENARQSSIFEGARGLPKGAAQRSLRRRRSKA